MQDKNGDRNQKGKKTKEKKWKQIPGTDYSVFHIRKCLDIILDFSLAVWNFFFPLPTTGTLRSLYNLQFIFD